MIRDIVVGGAEFFFYLTDGVMLADSVWIFIYVVLLALVLAVLPSLSSSPRFVMMPSVVALFIAFFVGIGVPITQSQMLTECKSATATMQTDRLSRELEVNECRYKKNYYGEFGEWEIRFKN